MHKTSHFLFYKLSHGFKKPCQPLHKLFNILIFAYLCKYRSNKKTWRWEITLISPLCVFLKILRLFIICNKHSIFCLKDHLTLISSSNNPIPKRNQIWQPDKQRKEKEIFESFRSSSVSSHCTISMDCLETLPTFAIRKPLKLFLFWSWFF